MRPTCGIHVVWHYFVLEPPTSFSLVLWLMLWPHYQMWLMWLITSNPNPRVLKMEKMKNKWKRESKMKENKKKQSPLSVILITHSDFFLSSEIATTWQTDSTAYKLKLRSFHKSTHLWVYLVDFYLQCEPYLTSVKSTDYILGPSYYIIYSSGMTVEYLTQILSRVPRYLQLLK